MLGGLRVLSVCVCLLDGSNREDWLRNKRITSADNNAKIFQYARCSLLNRRILYYIISKLRINYQEPVQEVDVQGPFRRRLQHHSQPLGGWVLQQLCVTPGFRGQ